MGERVKDRVAIVTGAGRGIGAAIARRLAAEGAVTCLVDVHRDHVVQVAGQIPQAVAYPCDVAVYREVAAVVAQVFKEFGRIDILVNNAATVSDHHVIELTESEWDRTLATNLKGAFAFCKEAAGHMMAQRCGRMVNIAARSIQGRARRAAYSASKAGMVGLTRSLALDLGPHGITVNCVAPGVIETELTKALYTAEEQQKYYAHIPLQRRGLPDDVANAVLFLASGEADYITGQVLYVCGGLSVGISGI